MNEAELILDAKATLAEGPCWDEENQLLYWVDIIEKTVHIYDPTRKAENMIEVGQYVGAIGLKKTGGLIAALHHGFYDIDLKSKGLTPIVDPEKNLLDNRFNDGKCDPAGRFWAGTMGIKPTEPNGALYCLDHNQSVKRVVSGVTISNGLAWSPDHKTMYYIDTPTQCVFAFDYHIQSGEISNRRVAVSIPTDLGAPDGMTMDEEGMLWIALWGGSQVSRWNPLTGELISTVFLQVSQVTSCAFGGENLNELYITSAKVGLDKSELVNEPLAGGIFRVVTDVKGMPSYKYSG